MSKVNATKAAKKVDDADTAVSQDVAQNTDTNITGDKAGDTGSEDTTASTAPAPFDAVGLTGADVTATTIEVRTLTAVNAGIDSDVSVSELPRTAIADTGTLSAPVADLIPSLGILDGTVASTDISNSSFGMSTTDKAQVLFDSLSPEERSVVAEVFTTRTTTDSGADALTAAAQAQLDADTRSHADHDALMATHSRREALNVDNPDHPAQSMLDEIEAKVALYGPGTIASDIAALIRQVRVSL